MDTPINVHASTTFYKIAGKIISYLKQNTWENVITIFFFQITQQQAASTPVFCASAPELEGITGCYFSNCYRCDPSKTALNPALAERLWFVSEKMFVSAIKVRKFHEKFDLKWKILLYNIVMNEQKTWIQRIF